MAHSFQDSRTSRRAQPAVDGFSLERAVVAQVFVADLPLPSPAARNASPSVTLCNRGESRA